MAQSPQRAGLRFVIRGEMADPLPLGSGSIRHQLGVMLQQQDQCNLVYAMLRLDGTPRVVVQEKYNPGLSKHEECGNRGYQRVAAQRSKGLTKLAEGVEHEMAAEITGGGMIVWLDGKQVWKGSAPKNIIKGDRIGFRSDNVEVEYSLSDMAPLKIMD